MGSKISEVRTPSRRAMRTLVLGRSIRSPRSTRLIIEGDKPQRSLTSSNVRPLETRHLRSREKREVRFGCPLEGTVIMADRSWCQVPGQGAPHLALA